MSKEIEFVEDGLSSAEYEQRVLRMKAAPDNDDLYAELIAGMSPKQVNRMRAGRARAVDKISRQVARAVNQEVRAAAEQHKQEQQRHGQRARRHEVFDARDVVRELAHKHPRDIKTQLNAFLSIPRMAAIGTRREVSQETQTEYRRTLTQLFKCLESQSLLPSNLYELGRVHVIAAVKNSAQRELSAGHMQNMISRLRRFFVWMGRDGVVPTTAEIEQLIEMGVGSFRREKIATRSLAWNANGVDVQEMLSKVAEYCPRTAILLELQAAFGLRVKESLMLRPRYALEGNHLHVIHGTKGGRARSVALASDELIRRWQLDLLERANRFADQHRRGDMGYTDLRLKESLRRYYYVMERQGINRAEQGVTSHGLRHMYVARRYRDLVGTPPPVEGLERKIDARLRNDDLIARLVISEELGHSRATITQAYSGSVTQHAREQKKVFNLVLQITEQNPEFQKVLGDFNVRRCWVGGSLGAGYKPRKGEQMQILLEFECDQTHSAETTRVLSQALFQAMKEPVLFFPVPFGMEPQMEAFELKLKKIATDDERAID